MKKILLFVVILNSISQIDVNGQASINLALKRKLDLNSNSNNQLFILVKGDVDKIHQFVDLNGGQFIHSAGDIVSLKLSMSAIALLIEKPFVKQIGYDVHHYKTMNDTMRMLSHVDEVHAGQIPLSHSYNGRGVLLGIIDSGLDLNHPDFKDSTGHTRVKYLWDMTLPYNNMYTPALYGYGQEFTNVHIDNGLASAHTGEDEYGHGTYVTGIAAGNGSAVGHFKGVAAESDLIIVCYPFNAQDTVSHLAHAVEYIFAKADLLGMPVVINASLGDYYGSHDGLDLESQYISYMINQHPGRALVAAAGNIGANYPFHVGRNSIAGDTVFTWFKYNTGYQLAYIQVFADTADFRNVKFSIGADQVTPYFSFRGATAFSSVFPSINHSVIQTLYNGPNRLGTIETYTSRNGGVYSMEVFVSADSIGYNWRFTTTGSGKYDSWTFDWAFQNLPDTITYPDMVHYFPPDTLQSMVSGIACLGNVITVGNYNNTDRHVDVDSILQIDAVNPARILGPNSGRGPTRLGIIKPDVCAPGNHILSAGVSTLIPGLTHDKVALGGFHITGGGTSASAPVVAGIAALYLEQNPTANWQDIQLAIKNCAYQDSFTWGPYPNNAWGSGKVDAFASLTTCALNINVSKVNAESDLFNIYPNPSSDNITIENITGKKIRTKIFDVDGKLVYESNFIDKINIPISGFNNGIYTIQLNSESLSPVVRRLVVSR